MRKLLAKIFFRISYLCAGKNYHSNLFCLPGEHVGQALVKDGAYESGVIKSVKKFLLEKNPNNNIVRLVDVGANIGTHTIGFADVYSSAVSFEPNPIISQLLELNLAINKISHACVRRTALSDLGQKMALNVPSENHGNASLADISVSGGLELLTSTLDNELLGQFNSDDLIILKIDVEGHELEVIKGAMKFLQFHNVIIVVEHNKSSKTDILYNLLEGINYKAEYQVKSPRFSSRPFYRIMSLLGLLKEDKEGPFERDAAYIPAVIFSKNEFNRT